MNMSEVNSLTDQNMSEIDKAIAAAIARKAAKETMALAEGISGVNQRGNGIVEPKRKIVDEDRAARIAAYEQERAVKKAAREAARAEKLAKQANERSPAHMNKVIKAAEKLGVLGGSTKAFFDEATTNLSTNQIALLALHLQHFNRIKSTERALTSSAIVKEGQEVMINGGDRGKVGIVERVQRIRCYVAVDGFDKPAYCFISDVVPVEHVERQVEPTEDVEATPEVEPNDQ